MDSSPIIPDSLPINIRRANTAPAGMSAFTITMSQELVQQLALVAAPFLRELCESVEAKKQRNTALEQTRVKLQSETKSLFFAGLKVIHAIRSESCEMLNICERVGLLHNLNPQILLCEARRLQKIRLQRYTRFQERRIAELLHMGLSAAYIAKRVGTSLRHVKQVIESNHTALSPSEASYAA